MQNKLHPTTASVLDSNHTPIEVWRLERERLRVMPLSKITPSLSSNLGNTH